MRSAFAEIIIERDKFELSLGDILDVKAGILLAIIAVLGTLLGIFLSFSTLGRWWQLAQFTSIVFLAIGCVLAVGVVIPRSYQLAADPELYRNWINSLHFDSEQAREEAVTAGIIQKATERILINHEINKAKSRLLNLSFWATVVALLIDMAILLRIGATKIPF